MTLAELLKDSAYKLTQFKATQITALEAGISKKVNGKDGTKTPALYVNCLVRNKPIKLTPEEAVRQLYVMVLRDDLGYPVNRMELEYGVTFGREKKRADICIFDKDKLNTPYILVEVKKPKLKDGKEQLKSYCNATGAPMGVWSNGESISFYHRKDPNYFEDIPAIPSAREKLSDVLSERWTIDDLIKRDKLVNEKKSLKDLILEMEDEVLANAGVDVFEELFKLIFTKLFDEMESGRDKKRHLIFKNYGDTETELKAKIQELFDKARAKWEGVFPEGSKLELTPSHLAVCVASLEKVKLFNSNLDVVDEAFEYLISKSSKGEKGQYFTPRYVIDMCVKMLNPQEHEMLMDTAAGSCGFPVHGIFHVWEQILKEQGLHKSHLFTAEKKPVRCETYVQEKVFAIDFDEKAVRVGRTLNLIAGDGQTNVLHLNTLDYERWYEKTGDDKRPADRAWNDTYGEGWKKLRKLRTTKDQNRDFKFDVLMANPPFAGDIKETRILAKYELGKKNDGKYQTAVGRDILFIERNLSFVKPGGRLALVLPQGRFNNSSDKRIRDYMAEHCRILAVVGLHGNVFKPHTGTKTSVIFLQKWNDNKAAGELCPKLDDYPIFFATMREPSKDNSGDKIFVKRKDLQAWTDIADAAGSSRVAEPINRYDTTPRDFDEFVLDEHEHLVVKHDLFSHELKDGKHTPPGIAEAFVEFAKKEKLSFFSIGPFDAARYRVLLEGLEISEILLSKVRLSNPKLRIDSGFFSKPMLESERLIRAYPRGFDDLGVLFSRFVKGIFEINSDAYVDKGIPFLRIQNLKNSTISETNLTHIPEALHATESKTQMLRGDIVLSKTAYPAASLVTVESCNTSQDTIATTLSTYGSKNYLPEAIVAYLNCSYGNQLLWRQFQGNVQLHLGLEDGRKVPVPRLALQIQRAIKKVFNDAMEKKVEAAYAYAKAEKALLSTIQIADIAHNNQTINIRSLKKSFDFSGRLDAEYYQPKFEDLLTLLSKDKLTIGVVAPPRHERFEVGGAGEFQYLEIGGLAGDGTAIAESVACADAPSRATQLVCAGDVITSTVRPIRKLSALISPGQEQYVCSSGFIVLEPKLIAAEVLLVYLRLSAICELMDLHTSASLYPAISEKDLLSLPIPKISASVQKKISVLVQESFSLKAKSKHLLEVAKRAVEIAIEKNEAAGLAYLKRESVSV